MPDAPKIPADDDICYAAWRPRFGSWPAFRAGWRAAMAEVKKERDHLDQIVQRAEKVRYDHSREGF